MCLTRSVKLAVAVGCASAGKVRPEGKATGVTEKDVSERPKPGGQGGYGRGENYAKHGVFPASQGAPSSPKGKRVGPV